MVDGDRETDVAENRTANNETGLSRLYRDDVALLNALAAIAGTTVAEAFGQHVRNSVRKQLERLAKPRRGSK